jgi:hypothetical protein
MDPITMAIMAGISGLGGLFSSIGKTRAASRENQAQTQKENLAMQLQLDARNKELGMGVEMAGRRAAKLEDLAGIFREFGDRQDPFARQQADIAEHMMGADGRGLLQAEAQRQLERGSGFMDSVLASRGMHSSGYGATQQRMLASETMGSLAQAIAQNQMQGLAGASNIYGGLGQQDMQRQMAMLSGLQGIYGDQAWSMAGMDPSQFMLDPEMYRNAPLTAGFADYLTAGLGGLFGGVGTAFSADAEGFTAGIGTGVTNWQQRGNFFRGAS